MKVSVAIVTVMALAVTTYIFSEQTYTAKRWQDKAIEEHQRAVQEGRTPPSQPEEWWYDNPFKIGLKIWIDNIYSWVSIIVSMISGLVSRFSKKEDI